MWTSGKHAAPIAKSYSSRISSISSREYSQPALGRGPLRLAGAAGRRAARARSRRRRRASGRASRAARPTVAPDAGEVRHRLDPVVALDVRTMSIVLRFSVVLPAGAVGDRHERRVEARAARPARGRGCARPRRSSAGRTRRRRTARRRARSARRSASRSSLGGEPALRLALHRARTAPAASRWVEVAEHLGQQPARRVGVELVPVDRGQQLEGGRLGRARERRAARASSRSRDQRAVGRRRGRARR